MTFQAEIAEAWGATAFDPREVAKLFLASARLLFVGNGGSAAIASHMANDFAQAGGKVTLCFNDAAALTCIGNDYGYDDVFQRQVEQHAKPLDTLVAISSSGRSRNIVRATGMAHACRAQIVTLTGFDELNPLRRMGAHNIWVPSHDYGVVETIHLGMLHAILREVLHAR